MRWIKFDTATPDKPEVWEIASILGIDPDAVVGKLLRVWGWFDEHTEEGNAPSVTKKLLDRLVGVSGFADAMHDAGWLLDDGETISLPNFDRHNGQTAKNRALTAQRVSNHKRKSNARSVTAVVTSALPKEEEEKIKKKDQDQKLCAADAPPAQTRASRLPVDWSLPPDWHAEAEQIGLPSGAIPAEAAKFRDYWVAKSGKDATKTDWQATWRNWCRNAAERMQRPSGKSNKHDLSTMNYGAGVAPNGRF